MEKYCSCDQKWLVRGLSETIRRIVASLTAQNEKEKEKLREEDGRLKQLLENEVMKSGIELENLRSRIKELEMTVAEAERKKDQAIEESIAAKGEALAATTDHQMSVAQIARLELELSLARKKLGATTSDPASGGCAPKQGRIPHAAIRGGKG